MTATWSPRVTPGRSVLPLRSAGVIDRPRLFELLDKGTLGLLTAVSGPVGTGKTDLLISWLEQARLPGPVRWVQTPSTSDPVVFWSSILDAVADLTTVTPANFAGSGPDREALQRILIEAFRNLAQPVTVIADDFHRAAAGSDSELNVLARHCGNLRMIVAGRAVLGPEFLPLRVSGQLYEVDAPELAFTESETRNVADRAGIDGGPHDLHERTEGWPAAVRLALRQLERDGCADAAAALETYVRSGILPTISADDLLFLQRTSLVERLEPAVLTALTETGEPIMRLPRLRAAGLIVGTPGREYRHHRLLRGVLLHDQATSRPDETAALHRGLAVHFRSDRPSAALAHACAADDPATILAICREHWFALAQLPDAVVQAFHQVPQADWQNDAESLLAVAAAHRGLPGHEHSASMFLAAAQDAARRQGDGSIRTAALLATGWQFTHLNSGDHGQAVTARTSVAARLREIEPAEAIADAEAISFFHAACGLTKLVLGEFSEAATDFQAGRTAATISKNAHALLVCASGQILLDALTGRLGRVDSQLSMVQQLAEELEISNGLITSPAYIGAGLAALERQQPAVAEEYFQMAHATAAPLGQLWPLLAYGRAAVLTDQGTLAAGLDVIRAAVAEFDQSQCSPFGFALLVKAEAELLLKFDQPDAARDALALIDTAEDPTVCLAATRARIAIYEGNPARAAELVQHWLTSARRQLAGMHVDAFATYAVAALLCGRKVEATRSYQQAVAMAERSGCRRGLSLIPRPLVPLLEGDDGQPEKTVLTPRERVVLGYIGRDATIREIAVQLSVSQNTLKTQLRGLYRKLGAGSRSEALDRARTLDLL